MAQSFKSAFADARREGRTTFPWKGKQYTTELAGNNKKPRGRAAQQMQRASDAAKRRASKSKPIDRSSKLREAGTIARTDTGRAAQQMQRASDAAQRRESKPKPIDRSSKLLLPGQRRGLSKPRGDRSVGNGMETARGQGVAEDTAAAGDIGRRDRGGLRALERGATVKGYEGTQTPGQRRGFEQTREAGKFPVYGKQMQAGQSFRAAFADARSKGEKTFPWQGRKYTTDLA